MITPLLRNDLVKIMQMRRAGTLPVGAGIRHLEVRHDDGCPMLEGKNMCLCDPDIRLKP